jgi:hypothetical protein
MVSNLRLRRSYVYFPLTPALSLGEREKLCVSRRFSFDF